MDAPREYNLWENTDIEYPEHSRIVLLRAVSPSTG